MNHGKVQEVWKLYIDRIEAQVRSNKYLGVSALDQTYFLDG